jgi:hypothetical protein
MLAEVKALTMKARGLAVAMNGIESVEKSNGSLKSNS